MNSEENINPDSWTEKELLKHLYREMKEMKIQQTIIFDDINSIKKSLNEISLDQVVINTKLDTKKKELDNRISKNNLVIGVIAVIIAAITFLWEYFK